MHPVHGVAARLLRVITGLSLLVAVLAGCGGGELAKATYPRTLVPPAGQPADAGDRLSVAGLRLLDPCGLLGPAVLGRHGEPDDNVAQDFDGCRNHLRDADGEPLNVSVRVGEPLTGGALDRATDRIGEFRAGTARHDGACFVTLVVDRTEPPVGVTVQASYRAGDPCPSAQDVAADIATRLPATAAVRTPAPGSLLPLDPCTLPGALPATAVPRAAGPTPVGLHQCGWRSPEGAELELQFAHRPDPGRSDGEPVALDAGITAHLVRTERAFAQCRLGWAHLPGAGAAADTAAETVEIEVRDLRDTGLDVCGAAVTFAKSLLPKLPKP